MDLIAGHIYQLISPHSEWHLANLVPCIELNNFHISIFPFTQFKIKFPLESIVALIFYAGATETKVWPLKKRQSWFGSGFSKVRSTKISHDPVPKDLIVLKKGEEKEET